MLEQISTRNKFLILTSTTLTDEKRAHLVAMQMIVERVGKGPLEMALRMVFEEALLCYLTGEFDRLHAMGQAAMYTTQRSGSA